MKITYDKVANAVYIQFKETKDILSTLNITDEINIDLDSFKNIVGIEILKADKVMDLTEIVIKDINND